MFLENRSFVFDFELRNIYCFEEPNYQVNIGLGYSLLTDCEQANIQPIINQFIDTLMGQQASVRSCGIRLWPISQEMRKISILDVSLKITNLR